MARWLGEDGVLLLSAMAVYPQLAWPLTRLLWSRLFNDSSSDTSGLSSPQSNSQIVLLRVVRLPCCQRGRIPFWLRERLINRLKPGDEDRIRGIYEDLFSRRLHDPGNEAIDMNLVSGTENEKTKLSREEQEKVGRQLASMGTVSPFNDALYAGVVMGKGRVTDFILPRWIERAVPVTYRYFARQLITPLLLIMAVAIVANGWWYQMGESQWRESIRSESVFGVTELQINHDPGFRLVAETIAADLESRGIKVRIRNTSEVLSEPITEPILTGTPETLLSLSDFVSHHLRGRQPMLIQGDQVILNLGGLNEKSPGTVFRDEWTPAERRSSLPDVFQDEFLDERTLGPKMRLIPGGRYQMGSDKSDSLADSDERPRHWVNIKPFAMGQYEVTFDEYDTFAVATDRRLPHDRGWGRGLRPVINVSWDDAKAYAAWLSEKTGERYRLPSESEWEYVSRGGTDTQYWWGDDIGAGNANCADCGSEWDGESTAPVGSFSPNAFGVYDTSGNVWEWVEDCWHPSYVSAPEDGAAWLAEQGGNCSFRVLRSGSWLDSPSVLRSAGRNWTAAAGAFNVVGFRLARTL